MGTDRNLLFAVLALQVDLLDNDRFIEACTLWATRKQSPITALLVERGWLTTDDVVDVERLLERKLKKHRGDVRASLAGLTVPQVLHHSMLQVPDDELYASLSLLSTPRNESDAWTTRPPSMGTPTSSGTRFHILRPHARGGLGEVFVAHDSELNRQVALKEMQDRHADDPRSRARFLLEAEVTGGLEHPGVVPVYGLGRYPDGRPFYAMRFIRGESLQAAIARYHESRSKGADASHSLEFELRTLLTRFIAICNAVAYAHSRGVLHRDIKPANIMLGPFGETLLVDWGLAKSGIEEPAKSTSERTAEAPLRPSMTDEIGTTLQGSVLGTPAYMSPEQAAGRLDLLGPASDVYSLGATLYCLLTGKAPFAGGDRGELLARVERGEYPAPRLLNEQVAAPLEAICLKAMALRPQERYTSARALAVDLEHWLADEPVAAYPEPVRARLGRWGRRHRSVVTGAAAALLVAALSLMTSTLLLSAANGRERSAKELAQQREQEANDNFQMARDAVDRYCTNVSEDPRLKQADFRPLRGQLLQTAVEFYQKFIDEHRDEPALRVELARAWYRLGLLTEEIQTAAQAIPMQEQAAALFEQLANEQRDQPELRFSLARCLARLGALYHSEGRKSDARLAHTRAIELMQALRDEDSREPKYTSNLANFIRNFANFLLYACGEKKEAEDAYKQALALLQPLSDSHPDRPDYQLDLASIYNNLGVLYQQDHPADAEKMYQRGRVIMERLHERYPKATQYTDALAGTYGNLGNLYQFLSRVEESAAHHKKSLELVEQLVRDNPSVLQHRKDLANGYNNLAGLYQEMGRLTDAEATCRKALPLLERFHEDEPNNALNTLAVCAGYGNLANTLRDVGKHEEALTWYGRALPQLEALLKSDNSDPLVKLFVGQMHGERALTLARAGRQSDALAEMEPLIQGKNVSGETYYKAAQVYGAVARASKQEAQARRAVELLRSARAAGYFQERARIEQMNKETDFVDLRSRDDYRELLTELTQAGKSKR
jgi:serine/threonine-protein kinase